MRYGNPSIHSALAKLKDETDRIIVLPLYPHYAESSFETAVVETRRSAQALGCRERLTFLPPFYDRPEFLDAFASRIRQSLTAEDSEHVVFSFHSLPERHLKKLDPEHCLRSANCCDHVTASNRNCYRAQALCTAGVRPTQLGLNEESYTVFQSRPAAQMDQPEYRRSASDLARRGKKRMVVPVRRS
jgi:ferrochelatase